MHSTPHGLDSLYYNDDEDDYNNLSNRNDIDADVKINNQIIIMMMIITRRMRII